MSKHPNAAIAFWLIAGALSYLLLPWYAIQDTAWYAVLPQVFGGTETANGLLQSLQFGRSWLLVGVLGLLIAAVALFKPASKGQGTWLMAGGLIGALGLAASGFAIGSKGWSFAWLNASFGELATNQFGIGIGGFVALMSLVLLAAFGIARRGYFKGDLFVAASVVGCGVLLLLFIAYPVTKALYGAFLNEEGRWSVTAIFDRMGNERVWGLGCLAGGVRCGVAWNTLFLGLLTASGTVILGTMLALMAERGSAKLQGPLKVLAMLPIITPPFVVGLGLILLFGRAGIVNQGLEWAFGMEPTRWFYGLFGVWLAQLFAFTPIAFMIMRGVVQGVAPSLEEAAQTLRADRKATFYTITLPLLKPGLANAFLVGFIESMADFGNPIVVGGQFSVLSTEIFFAMVGAQYDQGRAASLAWILTLFALAVFAIQRGVLGKQNVTPVSGGSPASFGYSKRSMQNAFTVTSRERISVISRSGSSLFEPWRNEPSANPIIPSGHVTSTGTGGFTSAMSRSRFMNAHVPAAVLPPANTRNTRISGRRDGPRRRATNAGRGPPVRVGRSAMRGAPTTTATGGFTIGAGASAVGRSRGRLTGGAPSGPSSTAENVSSRGCIGGEPIARAPGLSS